MLKLIFNIFLFLSITPFIEGFNSIVFKDTRAGKLGGKFWLKWKRFKIRPIVIWIINFLIVTLELDKHCKDIGSIERSGNTYKNLTATKTKDNINLQFCIPKFEKILISLFQMNLNEKDAKMGFEVSSEYYHIAFIW